MKIYIAASLRFKHDALILKTELEKHGHEVTSRWLGLEDTQEDFDDERTCRRFAEMDFLDIKNAECVVICTTAQSTTGGLHIETGYAIGIGKKVIIYGPKTSIFHSLAQLKHALSTKKLLWLLGYVG